MLRKSPRKFAGILASVGVGFALLGSGVYASFTQTATATDNIAVGTQAIQIVSSTPGAVVTNSGATHTVTYTAPTIQSSAPGTAPLDFQINNTGSMPITVTVASSDGFTAPWSDMFVNPGPKVIAAGGSFDYTGGIQWSTLGTSDEGSNHSVTYTITATS